MPIQVAADIEADIDSGALAPDTRLPSEAELATQYGVARVSVRRAIELLRERGKVLTFHGRGTYVAEKPGELETRDQPSVAPPAVAPGLSLHYARKG